MSTFITESWLRERHGLSEGTELRLPADARLTPAARALIDERHLSLKFHDEQGRLYRATEEPDADGAPCLQAVHGLTGSLDFSTVGVGLPSADRLWIALALVLILVGYGFEITMVPLHFWAPDVFAGASGPVAGFLAVVPKIAGVAALLRFLLQALPAETVAWPL